MSKATDPKGKTNPLEEKLKAGQSGKPPVDTEPSAGNGEAPKKEDEKPAEGNTPEQDVANPNPDQSIPDEAPKPPVDDATNGEKPPYELSPDQQTPEQKAYVAAYNEYVDTFNEMPNGEWDTTELTRRLNEEAKRAAESKQEATKIVASDERYVVAEKDGQKKRFTRITWNQMQGDKDGWKEIPVIPAEVQALQRKKEGK